MAACNASDLQKNIELFSGVQPKLDVNMSAKKHTQTPITTTSSVLAVKFIDGVLIVADTQGSYGKMARHRNCERILRINDQTILGCSGDYADFQHLQSFIDQKVIDDECANDGFKLKPRSLYSWLTRVLYNRRSKFDPLWCTYVIGGIQDGKPFIGYVDKLGAAFEADHVATGYGAYMALPLIRDKFEQKKGQLTKEEAVKLLKECLKVLYYRDCVALNRYTMAVITKDGAQVEGPFSVETNWDIAAYVKGY